jgi:Mycothiol maleylpyruvate isomerase N-terminal domain
VGGTERLSATATMTPELRAVLDRFILDTANTKFVAFNLPADALDRQVAGVHGTVRQLFGHIAGSMGWYAEALSGFVVGTAPTSSEGHHERNTDQVARAIDTPLSVLVTQIDGALNGLMQASTALSDEQLSCEFVGRTSTLDTLRTWSRHFAGHGLDFADALPELRFDPMMLNWLLYADFRDHPARLARQRKLLVELRERYPAGGDDDGDDERE